MSHLSGVADAFRKKLENWHRIAPNNGNGLREFVALLHTRQLAMNLVKDLETLNKESNNQKLVKVLPGWAHPKWGMKVRHYQ